MQQLHKEQLEDLRAASHQVQWNKCREVTRLLFDHVPESELQRILLKWIRVFLVKMHMDAADAVLTAEINALTTATNVGSASDSFDRLDSFLLGKSGQPGVNNFRNALRKVRNSEHPESLSSDRAVDALSGILMAILSYSWGIIHLELWNRSFHQQSHKDVFILARYFWRDPNTMQLNRELWNDVANDLESALKDL